MDLGLSEEQELLDLCVLAEEFGRALVPGPFIPNAVCAAELIIAGTDEHKSKYLPKIADGSAIHTYAITEPSGRWDREGIDGRLSTFIVPRDQSGVSVTVLKTIAADKQAEVVFKDVKVPAGDVIDMDEKTAARLRNMATNLECAYLVGLAQRDFEISVNYAKERVQFGRPIGSFQAIQHKAADMVTDVDGMRFIMYKAAWATSENEDSADMDTAMAKAWCSDASRRVVAHGQQIHGGIGFTKDYVIQLFFRRQKRAELFWGDGDFHRERVAQMLEI
jgi:alkylation response protein AidB-like acyl-CoA dehydrogenase